MNSFVLKLLPVPKPSYGQIYQRKLRQRQQQHLDIHRKT